MSFVEDETAMGLLEEADYQSELYLLRTSESMSAEKAEREMAPLLHTTAKLAAHCKEVRKGALDDIFVELSNREIRIPSGAAAIARVGINDREELLLFVTPSGCEHGHIYLGPGPKKATMHQLSLIGFKPRDIVVRFRGWVHDALVSSMTTMPGGDA